MNSVEQLKAVALFTPVLILFFTGFLIAVSSGVTTPEGAFSLRGLIANVRRIVTNILLYGVTFLCLHEIVGYRG